MLSQHRDPDRSRRVMVIAFFALMSVSTSPELFNAGLFNAGIQPSESRSGTPNRNCIGGLHADEPVPPERPTSSDGATLPVRERPAPQTNEASGSPQSSDVTRSGGARAEKLPRYADSVVEKADAILKEAGLRRSGKGLQAVAAAELSRELSSLTRERRELRMKQVELETAEKQLGSFEQTLTNLNRSDRDLNLQLAQVAGNDVGSNNRIVAMINATRSQVVETRRLQKAHGDTIKKLRGTFNNAEQAYSEKVFQTRKTLDELKAKLEQSLLNPQVKIALGVVHRNFEVPFEISSSQVLRSIDNRLAKFESEVFRDTIELDVGSNGSLFAMVSVNNQPIRMIVDSGATVVTIPAETATTLNLSIPADAPIVNLSLANGDRINARRIQLDSVRVGQFEATSVDAVVLGPIAGKAQPLLGLSYLDRYKFELNATAKTLGLLRVKQSP